MADAASDWLSANLAVCPEALARLVRAWNGASVRCQTRGDSSILTIRTADNGAYAACHGRHDPVDEAAAWLRELAPPGAGPELAVGVGASCGYALDAVERDWPGTKVIALEPEVGALRWLLGRRDWRPLLQSGRLAFLVPPRYETPG